MRRRTVQPEIRSLFRCSDPLSRHLTEATKNANCFEECNVLFIFFFIYVQRKCELSAIQEGSPRKRCKFLARKSAKLFANTKVHILARKSAKLIDNFSATKVTSLPSHSLCISLSLSPSAPHAQYSKRFRASYNNDLGILERMQDGVHSSTTGASARSWWTPTPASWYTAFADLLSAMEALPEAFLAGKYCIFITELHLLHLWVHSSPVLVSC